MQDWLIGAAAGGIVGKAVVHGMERRLGELPAARVRHVEFVWIAVGCSVALLARVV
jgi:hypothetical protein